MPWLFYWSCRNLPRIYVFLYKFKKKALIAPELTFMSSFGLTDNPINASCKKSKRKVQGVPQSQAAAHPGHQEEEETDKSKQAQIEQTHEKH